MFAFVRSSIYDSQAGALAKGGVDCAKQLAAALKKIGNGWTSIRTSPAKRTLMTAELLGQELGVPVQIDERIGMEGNIVDLMPPTEPHKIIFVTHLPILTRMLRSWSLRFKIEEPSLAERGTGYLVDTEHGQLIPVIPESCSSDLP